MKRGLQAAAFFVALALAWEAVARFGGFPPYLFPPLKDIALTFRDGLVSGAYGISVLLSLKRLVLGYVLALAVGTLTGVAIARVKLVENTLGVFVTALGSMPSICWLPLALLWFGLGDGAILFVVFMGAIGACTLGVADAIRQVPPILLQAGHNLGARGVRMATDVLLPAALAGIVTGYRQAWSFAWRSLMAAELLFSTPGLGNELQMGRDLNDMARVMSVILLILLVGVVVEAVVYAPIQKSLARRYGLAGH